ncbi:MAG: thioredoxin [Flavobacteriales bacterium]
MALDVTDATFEEVVLKSDKPVLVDFWAAWCGPCKMIAPAIDALATDFEGKAVIAKVDVDNNNESAASYGVRNIPTILFFKGGEIVDKHVGIATKDVLEAKLDALV